MARSRRESKPSHPRARSEFQRRLRAMRLESLESRQLMASDFRNSVDSLDVSGDGVIVPFDALVLINDLNTNLSRALPEARPQDSPYLDPSGDGFISPLDALLLINFLNSPSNNFGTRRLTEGSGLANTTDVTIGLGQTQGARNYAVQLNTHFDTTDQQGAVEDTLAVYLVDPSQPATTLLDRGTPGTALFTLSGTKADFIPGIVRWDGTVLQIDTSALANRDTGLLHFQLLQQDTDSGTSVSIVPLSNQVDAEAAPQLTFAAVTAVQAASAVNTDTLTSASQVEKLIDNIRFNEATGRYAADVTLHNTGPTIGRSVVMTLPGLPADVSVHNASGQTTGGVPYVSFADAIGSGGLATGDYSQPVTIELDDPKRIAFRWLPQILASQNHAPALDPINPQTIVVGQRLEIPLVGSDADGDTITYSLGPGAVLPTSRLDPSGKLIVDPQPGEVGTYSFDVQASDGTTTTLRPVSLTVNADPLTTTRISGTILATSGQPLANMRIEVGSVNVLTGADGKFTVDLGNGPVVSDTLKVRGDLFTGSAVYPFIAEKLPLLLEHDVAEHVNNVVARPIYLPPLDVAHGTQIDPTKDVTVTTPTIPGAAIFVAAGSLLNQQGSPFTGTLSITEVPVNLTPAALPDNLLPDFLVTIQPGDMVFATPAPLSLPNTAGYAPGTRMDLWSINPVTGQFDDVGDAQVSADGATVQTISGGIRNSSWHFVSPPPPVPAPPPPNNPPNDPCGCPSGGGGGGGGGGGSGGGGGGGGSGGGGSGGGGSGDGGDGFSGPLQTGYADFFPLPTGMDDFIPAGQIEPPLAPLIPLFPDAPPKPLPSTTPISVEDASGGVNAMKFSSGYSIMGSEQKLGLVYDSINANPQPIIHFGFNNTVPSDSTRLVGNVEVSRGTFSTVSAGVEEGTAGLPAGMNVWSLPPDGGSAFGAVQLDFRSLPTGRYNYTINEGLLTESAGTVQSQSSLAVSAAAAPAQRRLVGSTFQQSDSMLVVNTINSPFGAGWGIAGLQQIVDNPDGTAMLVDGNGSERLFRPQTDPQAPYQGPMGDFSKFEKLPNGTYRRTQKDQTVYQFNARNLLESITDRNGNQTTLSYDADGKLTKITDRAGLETTFTYSSGRVASFTEPGNQTTQLRYDADGNLIEVIDPDGGSQKYGYDSNHLLTSKTDRSGNSDQLVYDFAGRLSKTVASDGSVRQFAPMQVEGLYPREATRDLAQPPQARPRQEGRSSVVDELGNVTSKLLDRDGQVISTNDAVGTGTKFTRDQSNLVVSKTDARGHITLYEYDAAGNVTRIRDEVSGASTLGTISVPGEIDDFTFTARAGDRLFYDALGSKPGDIRATLTTPGGAILFNSIDADGDRGAFPLSETGTYRLSFQGNGGATGDYEFRLYLAPETISQLALDTPISDAINVPGEEHIYRFAGQVGDRIALDGVPATSGDIRYDLISPTGEYLVNFGFRENYFGPFALDTPGTYQLVVRGNGDAVGQYKFELARSTVQTTALTFDKTISGTISRPGDLQIYTFDGANGDRLFLDGQGGSGGDIRYRLVSPTGEYLVNFQFRNDDSPLLVLHDPGQYQLLVLGSGDDTGAYQFQMARPSVTTAPLTFDTPVTGTIDKPGDLDIYTFAGTSGDRLFLDGLAGSGGDIRYRLVGPTGEYVINFQYRDEDSGLFRLHETGQYQLLVFGNGDDTGTYQFQMIRPSQATTPLAFDTAITGSIDHPGDEKIYTFTGNAGDRIFLDGQPGSGGDLRYRLVGPTGEYVINFQYREDDSGTIELHDSGAYQLLVLGNGDDVGTYKFQMARPALTTSALAFNTPLAGSIVKPGDRQIFTFNGAAGKQIYIDATADPSDDLRYALLGPNGEQLINFGYAGNDSGPVVLPADGTYQLQVFGSGDNTGTYALQVLDPAAQPLPIGAQTTANLSAGRPSTVYRWNATRGQRLSLDSQSNIDGAWYVIGPGGQTIANAPLNQDFSATAPTSGQYAVLISSSGNAAPTSFTFQVTDATDAPVTASGLGAVKNGTITAGETDTYTFDIPAGTLLHFDVQGASPTQLQAQLAAPGGQQVFLSNDMSDRFAIAPRSGTYTLSITGDSASSTGGYSVVLTDAQAAASPITLGAAVTGTIASGAVNWHSFTATAGSRLGFNTNTGSDLRFTLVSPSGNFVIDTGDLRFNLGGQTVNETGQYLIAVFGNGQATGNYSFTPFTSNITKTAGAFNAPQAGNISVPGEVDVLTFAATAGQRIEFDAAAGNGDIRYHLISPTGKYIVSGADVRFDAGALNLGETGTYQMVIFGNGNATGSYGFTLASASINPSTLNFNTPVAGSLATTGEVDVYSFNGTAGQRIEFHTGGSGDFRYTIVSPTGDRIVENVDARFNANAFNLGQTGTYQLLVYGNGTSIGDYAFTIHSAPVNVVTSALGARWQSSIGTPGQLDVYRFTATAGQRVVFDTTVSGDFRYTLVSPSGQYVVQNADLRFDSDAFNLSESGTYQFLIYGNSVATGAYDVALRSAAINRQSMNLNAQVAGNLARPGDVNIYTFTGTAGQRVSYDTNNTSGNPVRFHLISPTGTYVINGGDSHFDTSAFNLEENGTYQLVLYSPGTITGNYDFQLRTATITSGSAVLGLPISGTISGPGELDTYSFTANAGQRLLIDSGLGTNANIRYDLISPSGAYVITNADSRFDTGFMRLGESGTWQINVYGVTTATGSYNLRLVDLASPTIVQPGTTISGQIDPGNGVRAYGFTAQAGQHLFFDALGAAAVGSIWQLVADSNQVVASQSLGTDLEYDVPSDGAYTLLLSGASTSPVAYSFRLTTTTPTTTQIALGSTISGSIGVVGEQDNFTFSAAGGQRIWFDSLSAGAAGISFRLVDPAGTQLQTGSTSNDVLLTLPISGLYRLEVDGSVAATGNYQFRLVDLEGSSSIGLNQQVNGSVPALSASSFHVAATKGQRLHFDDMSTGNVGTWLLFGPGGNIISNTAFGSDFDAIIQASGDYAIVLANAGNNAAAFAFRVTDISDAPVAASGFGSVHTGTATTTPQNFTYSASAGTRVVLDASTGGGVTYTLRDPQGGIVTTVTSAAGPLVLPRSGNYTLSVTGSGAFTFRLLDEDSAPRVPRNVLTSGDSTAASPRDLYRFSGVAGQQIYLDIAVAPNATGPLTVVTTPSGQVLVNERNNQGIGPFTLTETGTYLLSIDGAGTGGNYGFRLVDVVAAPKLQLGVPVNDFVSQGNQGDVYRLDVVAGENYGFRGSTQTTGSRVKVVSIDGNTLHDANIAVGFTLTPSYTGELFVIVDSNSATQSDAYGITFFQSEENATAIAPATQAPSPNGGDLRYTYDTKFNVYQTITDQLGHQIIYTIDPATGDRTSMTEVVGAVGGGDDVTTTYTYTSRGLVDTITDPLGRVTDYDYDNQGHPVKITYAKGTPDQGVYQYEYDARGNVTAVVDALGRRTTYAYNSRNQITSVTEPDPDGAGPLLSPVTSYTYDAAGLLTAATDPRGGTAEYAYDSKLRLIRATNAADEVTRYQYDNHDNVVAMIDPLGHRTSFSYDARNRLISQRDPLGQVTKRAYDRDGHLTQITDPRGNKTKYEYDARGRETAAQDALGHREVWQYDAASNVIAYSDPNGNTTRYAYDELNRPVVTVDALGGTITTAYDKAGNALSRKDQLNRTTQYVYDARDRLKTLTDAENGTTQYTYDAVGNLLTTTDALGRTTTTTYDALDRPITVTDPLSQTIQFSYDASGNETSTTGKLGDTTTYSYDAINRLTTVTDALNQQSKLFYDAASNITKATDRLNRTTLLSYDAADRLVSATDPAGNVSRMTYDAAGNIASSTDALGRVTRLAYDALNRQISQTDAAGGVLTAAYDNNGNLIQATDELGRMTKFRYDARSRLIETTDALGNASTRIYDPVSNLVASTDELGRQTVYSYDGLNRQTRTTDALGGQINTTYDAVGNVTSQSDRLGHTTTYSYDKLNRLTRSVDALGGHTDYTYDANDNPLSVSDQLGNVSQFTYDALNRQVTATNADGKVTSIAYDAERNITSITDALGRISSFAYDPLNRLSTATDALNGKLTYTYDAVGNRKSMTDQLGRTANFAYDALDRLTQITDALNGKTVVAYDAVGNILAVSDPLNHVSQYSYDALDRQTKMTDALGGVMTQTYDAVSNLLTSTDPLGHTTSFTYDALDRLGQITDALGGKTSYEYDANGKVLSMADPLNRKTSWTYDALDRPTSVTDALGGVESLVYDAASNIKSRTDPLNRTTGFDYDKLYRLTSVTDAAGGITRYAYDSMGNTTQVTDPLNRVTSFTYDALDRLAKVQTPLGNATSYAYDAAGQLTSATDGLNHATLYGYDALGRLVTRTDALGGQTVNTYDAAGNLLTQKDELNRVTGYAYDALDRLVESTNPLGNKTTYSFDAASRLTKVTDPLNHAISYAYDALNRRTSMTDAQNGVTGFTFDAVGNLLSVTDPLSNQTTYAYDALDRLVQDTNENGDSRTFGYDAVGNRTSATDRNGRKRSFTYDALDRQTAATWLDASNQPVNSLTYTYDAASQLAAAGDSVSKYAFAHDADGRNTSVTNAGTPGVPTVVFNYAFDAVNRLTSRTETVAGAAGATNTYSYDALDRVTRLTQSGTGTSDKRIDFAYDAASQLTGIDRFADLNGNTPVVHSTYVYDAASRLSSLTHAKTGGNVAAYTYTYDAADRLTKLVAPDGTSNYTYDARDQLTGVTNTAQPNETFGYDANGNRNTAGYTTAANNRLTSDGVFNYEYDKEGNRTQRTEIATGKTTQYAYDYRNRLTSVIDKDSNGTVTASVSYTYDVFDNRIAQSVDADGAGAGAAKTERYIYDGRQVAMQLDGAGQVTDRFLYAPAVDQVLADDRGGGNVLWSLNDHLGSVRDLVNSAGTLVDHISYSSFGKVTAETNAATDFLFGYTGQQRDSETGLDFYRARYYDPATGRFMSEDPIGFAGGDPNLYGYVGNAPTIFIDPSGLYQQNGMQTPILQGFAGGSSGPAVGETIPGLRAQTPKLAPIEPEPAPHRLHASDSAGPSGSDDPPPPPPPGPDPTPPPGPGPDDKCPPEEDEEPPPLPPPIIYLPPIPGKYDPSAPIPASISSFGGGVSKPSKPHYLPPMKGIIDPAGLPKQGTPGNPLKGEIKHDVPTSHTPPPPKHHHVPPPKKHDNGPGRTGTPSTPTTPPKQVPPSDEPSYWGPPGSLSERFRRGLRDFLLGIGELAGKTDKFIGEHRKEIDRAKDIEDQIQNSLLYRALNLLHAAHGGITQMHLAGPKPNIHFTPPTPHTAPTNALPPHGGTTPPKNLTGPLEAALGAAGLLGNKKNLTPTLVDSPTTKQGGRITEPNLPPKTIAQHGDVEIVHYTRSGDHGPPHVHVKGGGPEAKIGQSGKPIDGSPELTATQRKAVEANKAAIRKAIDQIGRWFRFNNAE